jgi:hypothetical protein
MSKSEGGLGKRAGSCMMTWAHKWFLNVSPMKKLRGERII